MPLLNAGVLLMEIDFEIHPQNIHFSGKSSNPGRTEHMKYLGRTGHMRNPGREQRMIEMGTMKSGTFEKFGGAQKF